MSGSIGLGLHQGNRRYLGRARLGRALRRLLFVRRRPISRHEALLELTEKDAQAQLDGIFSCRRWRHCDNTTVITHAGPETASRQSFRASRRDSRGVYQGCIRVRPDAQMTDARQMSRTLLLSRQAEIAIKPELEILADNVKCSHGATAGELDSAALFFLRARGIPEAEARALLVEGS